MNTFYITVNGVPFCDHPETSELLDGGERVEGADGVARKARPVCQHTSIESAEATASVLRGTTHIGEVLVLKGRCAHDPYWPLEQS